MFALRWCNYDSEENYFFEGPDNFSKKEFNDLCNKLLTEAAQIACQVNGNTYQEDFSQDCDQDYKCLIGWNNFVHVLAYRLLPSHGFKLVKIPTVSYFGPTIINYKEDDANDLLGEMLEQVIQYNKEVRNKQ